MDVAGVRQFTVDEYHRMADVGIFSRDDRLELIHGVVRKMSPRNRSHVVATSEIRQLFARGLAGRAGVYEEKPLRLDTLDSEPEPDVAIYSNPDLRAYGTDRTEALLVIEVADSSLQDDLTTKAELYAQGGTPEYWVVDLVHRVVHTLRDPKGGAYRVRQKHFAGSRLAPLSWPDFWVEVDALFPPEPY